MSETARGIGVRIEVATAYDPVLQIQLLERSNPAIARCAGHTLATGRIGHFIGRGDISDQAVRVINPTAGTFTCEALNLSRARSMPPMQFQAVSSWELLVEAAAIEWSEAGRELHRRGGVSARRGRVQPGAPGALEAAVSIAPQTKLGPAAAIIEDAAADSLHITLRATLHDGTVIPLRGAVTTPGFSLAAGALAAGRFNLYIAGTVCRPRQLDPITLVSIDDGAGNLIEIEV